ncbi:ATP-binding cassette domain-containing protein [Enterococcus entomosocium]|uniref:ABC transporter ATP-binding protein n=1 Tax=Enterococcus entomosocium TaxID=3034352 RepID=UPI003D6A6B1A
MLNETILRIEQLSKSYKQPIFRHLSFQLAQGEWLGIVGENGSGKSTLVKIIAGLEKADQGTIYLHEKNQSSYTRKEWAQQIQLVTQYSRKSLDPMKTVAQILREPLQLWHLVPAEQVEARIASMIVTCNLSTDILSSYPAALSGGQYQRVSLALSLLIEPAILICDEMTASLDKINERHLFNFLRTQKHMTVIMISHDAVLVNRICDRCIRMQDFKV